MGLSVDGTNVNSVGDLYNLLLPTIETLYNEYSYINMPKSVFKELIKEDLKSIIGTLDKDFSDLSVSYIEEILRTNLGKYIEKVPIDSETKVNEVNEYINKLTTPDDYEQAFDNLKNLTKYLRDIHFHVDVDSCTNLINNNKTLQNILSIIVNNKPILNLNDYMLDTFIDVYCAINGLKKQSSLDEYLENRTGDIDINKVYFCELPPSISHEESKALLIEIKNGNEKALNDFIEKNLRLVVSVAKDYNCEKLQFLDLIEAGTEGLMKVIEKFKIEKGFKFSTYARWWIKLAIVQEIHANDRTIKIPDWVQEELKKYKKAKIDLENKIGREPNLNEVANYLNWSEDKISELEGLHDVMSLSMPVGDDEDSELADFIPDYSPSTQKQAERDILVDEVHQMLIDAELSETEIAVLTLYYGLGNTASYGFNQIEKKLGIASGQAKIIHKLALDKLSHSECCKGFEVYVNGKVHPGEQQKVISLKK